ncbi:MAG TPA: cupin domain-containing protein [Pyrinomonadaceae bacterium]|nr:cupin domain-containing protein [Pyrinomonadaceae bacterium]
MISHETITSALVTDWNSIKKENTAPGIQRQMVIGKNLMVCRFTFEPFLVTPEHSHPHEQVTLVVQGKVKFIIDGDVKIMAPGDVLYFPSNNRHGATMLDEEVILIDIFSPIREDFLVDNSANGDSTTNGTQK